MDIMQASAMTNMQWLRRHRYHERCVPALDSAPGRPAPSAPRRAGVITPGPVHGLHGLTRVLGNREPHPSPRHLPRTLRGAPAPCSPRHPPSLHQPTSGVAMGRRAGGVAAAAAAAEQEGAAELQAAAAATALRQWLVAHGGFVHEALYLSGSTQCGSRGLVASRAISLPQLESGSLVVVPTCLHLDNRAAVAALSPHLGGAERREAFAGLRQVQQVACYLASERAKGRDSFWLPYISMLPDTPPNPWLLSGPQLSETLDRAAAEVEATAAAEAVQVAEAVEAASAAAAAAARRRDDYDEDNEVWEGGGGPSADSAASDPARWAAGVEAARRRYGLMAEETLEVVGAAAGAELRLEREGLMWALGQVVSRSLGCGRSSGLLPFIDLANHDPSSRPPLMMLDDSDRLVFAVTHIRGGELAPLEAGEELFISYQAEDMSPLQAWLKWGFVPGRLVRS